MIPGRCIHWLPRRASEPCGADIVPDHVRIDHTPREAPNGSLVVTSWPCYEGLNPCKAECPKQRMPTEEEVVASHRERDDRDAAIAAGFSPCCGEPLDESRVRKDGPCKGMGPRDCPKCKEMVYYA